MEVIASQKVLWSLLISRHCQNASPEWGAKEAASHLRQQGVWDFTTSGADWLCVSKGDSCLNGIFHGGRGILCLPWRQWTSPKSSLINSNSSLDDSFKRIDGSWIFLPDKLSLPTTNVDFPGGCSGQCMSLSTNGLMSSVVTHCTKVLDD